MGISKGISARMLLTKGITPKQNKSCLNFLVKNNFEGYDYKAKAYIAFENVLKEDPNDSSYSCRYKNENFVISCPVDDDIIIINGDLDSNDSAIILKITDEFCQILNKDVDFSYIDNEGDSPIKFQKTINDKDLKWLFKYNYFGKNFIKKYGKEFFLSMPCVKQEFIAEDIIKIDLAESIFKPIDKDLAQKVNAYLEEFDIKVTFYNYKNFLID